MNRRAKTHEGRVHVIFRAVADDRQRRDRLIAFGRRHVARNDPKRIVREEDAAENATTQGNEPEVRIRDLPWRVGQFRLGRRDVDHARRRTHHRLQIIARLSIEHGEKLRTREAEINVPMSHGHGIRRVRLRLSIRWPER